MGNFGFLCAFYSSYWSANEVASYNILVGHRVLYSTELSILAIIAYLSYSVLLFIELLQCLQRDFIKVNL